MSDSKASPTAADSPTLIAAKVWLSTVMGEFDFTLPSGAYRMIAERIAADRALRTPASRLTNERLAAIYHEATDQHLRPQDERLAFLFARAIEAEVRATTPAPADRQALADDIKAAAADLAGGKVFPDLIEAVDRLASLPAPTQTAPSTTSGSLKATINELERAAWQHYLYHTLETRERLDRAREAFTSTDGVTRVPVKRDFRSGEQIGWLQVRTDALPKNADYVFALGVTVDDCTLMEVALVSDESYIGYLRQIGALK